jgi:acyl-coenzyme A thioesterase PaaI-like protein
MAVAELRGHGAPQPAPKSICFGCGTAHPHGLHLCFAEEGDDRVKATWRTDASWQGYDQVIHGGIVSTALDEAMSKAIGLLGIHAFTCELRVRFREHVAPDEQLSVSGWVVEKRKRKISTEAAITDSSGRERAHAWATFLEFQQNS